MALEEKQVVVDHNTVFAASRPGMKTGLGALLLIAFIIFCIYLPQLKAMVGVG